MPDSRLDFLADRISESMSDTMSRSNVRKCRGGDLSK